MQSTEEISKAIQPSQADQPNAAVVLVKPLSALQVSMSYEYEDSDINTLLEIKVKDIPSVVGVINYVLGAGDNIVPNQLQRGIQDCINELRKKPSAQHNQYNLLIPFNLGCYHWVSLLIRLDANFKATKIVYCDSLKKVSQVPECITTAINKLWPNIPVTLVELLTQPDMKSCGVLAIVNLMNIIQERNNNKTLSEAEIQELRRSDLLLVKDKRPDYFDSFYQRQLANRSSVAAIPKQVAMLSQEVKFSPQEYKRIMQGYELIKDISDDNLNQLLQECLKDKVEFNDKVHLYLQQIRIGFNSVLSQKISHKDRDKENINRLISLFFGFEPGEAPLTDLSDNKFRLEHEELRMLGKLLNGEDIASLKEFTQSVDTQIKADEAYAKKLQEEYQCISLLRVSSASQLTEKSLPANFSNPKSTMVAAKGELIGKNKEDYVRLKGTAADIVKILELLPPEKRYEYLVHASSLTSYSDPTTQKLSSQVPITNNLLHSLQSLNVEGSAILGSRISSIGIDVVPEAKEQPVHIEASELANKLDEVLNHVKILSAQQLAVPVKIEPKSETEKLFSGSLKIIEKLHKHYKSRINIDYELSQALNYYVPAECRFKEDTKSFNIRRDLHNDIVLPHIQNTSAQRSPLLLLQGESGSGKSLYVNWLEKKLWDTCSDMSSPIPILIELRNLKPIKKRIKNVNLLEDYLCSIGFSDDEILELKNDFRTVIILDGFDEIPNDNDDQKTYNSQSLRIPDNLYLTNQLHTWKAHVIITCRTQYLRNHRNYADWFVYKPGASIKEAEITPFHQKQIERYLTIYTQHNPPPAEWGKNYFDIIKGLNGVFELISNPLILFMVLRSLRILLQRQAQSEIHSTPDIITRTNIYEAFIQEWFDREVQRTLNSSLNIRSKDLRMSFYKYCMRLAFKMYLQELVSVTYHPISHEPIDEYALEPTSEQLAETKQWEEFFSTTDPQIVQIRFGCPLRLIRIENNPIYTEVYEYSFYHRSFLEYFAARHLYLTLHLDNTEPTITQQMIVGLEKRPINEKLLKNEPGITEFFAQMVQYQPPKLYRLLSIVLASRNNLRVSKAASNALTLLTKARFSFSNLDLSHINAPEAVLDDIIADTTNFHGANLTGASLSQAWMRKSDIRDCQLWEAQFGERPYLEFQENVHCISASHDGKLLAVGIERTITLWDIENMSLLKTFEGHAGKFVVICIALSRNGQLLISGSENIRIWNTSTGKCVKVLTEHSNVQCLSLSTNEKLLASGSNDKTVRVWEISSGSCIQILQGHEGGITCLSISANGERVYSGSYDKTIRVWDVSLGSESCKIECSSQINSLAIISDTERVIAAATNHDNFVSIWDVNAGQCDRILAGDTSNITAVSIDEAGEHLVSGGWDKTIRVWDILTGQCKKIIKGNPANRIHRLHLTANGKRLFSISRMSDDRTVRIWDLFQKNASQLDNNTSLESSIHISSDGKILASGTMGGGIRIWNVASGQCVYTLTGHTKPVFSVIFSSNNNFLASADQQSIRIWNLSSYECIQTIHSRSAVLNAIAFNADTNQLASGDNNGTIRIWDTVTGQCKHVLYGHEGFIGTLVLCGDGKRIVSGGRDHTVRIWNIQKGKCDILYTHNGIVDSISLSADNRLLASADRESAIRIWDLETYICLGIINLHSHSHEFLNEDGSPRVVSRSNGSITFNIFSSEDSPSTFSFAQKHTPHLRTFSNAGGGAICLPLSTVYFNYVSINSNGTYLATASGEKVNIWKVATGESIATFCTSSDIRRIHYYYPDTIAICCEVSSLQLWRRVREKNLWYLAWSGHSRPLVLTDCQIDNRAFESLTFVNRLLLKQRNALIERSIQASEHQGNSPYSDLEENKDQLTIDNLSSLKVSTASIMVKRGSAIFTAAPSVSQNINPSKIVISKDEVLPDWLTGDHISPISDAMLKSSKWLKLNRLIEFSPAIDLHADDSRAGSLKNTLGRKIQELRNEKSTPIFSFALNLSPNLNAAAGQGCHWIYGMIIHKSNKSKAILINSLNKNSYQLSLLRVKTILQTQIKIMDTDIKIIHTGYQNDAFNCGIWILVLLEKTLESLNIHRDKFIDFSLEEIKKQLLLGNQVNLNQFINEKRKEYDEIYKRHVKNQDCSIEQINEDDKIKGKILNI